ncbi:MAG: TetR/AcrR family transcriptional regulator [Clostridia bacterium]|nr:TetR/AcrR family transcriptional regulator [Clostridia bacterium]
MPAKKVITKEDILNAALEIVRESGIEALNMRSVAKRCNCSTQPIYLSFNGMEDLKKQVNKKVLEVFQKYMDDEVASGKYETYKAVGMGYIRFAKEEKELFKYAMMHQNMVKDGTQQIFDNTVFMIMKNYGLYQDQASRLHMHMWIFVHGIASIFATEYIDIDWETVSQMLSDAYFGTIKQLKGENK